MFSPIFFAHVRNIDDIVVHGDLRLFNKKMGPGERSLEEEQYERLPYKKAPVPWRQKRTTPALVVLLMVT